MWRMDSSGIAAWLHGDALFSGLYLNELLMRLLPAEAPHPALFEHYTLTLQALAAGRPLEPLLRSFEWRLLDELGLRFSLNMTSTTSRSPPTVSPARGCRPGAGRAVAAGLFNGTELLALAEADWDAPVPCSRPSA
jgi:DNA repair protein RecO (recombination protein O)